MALHNRDGTPVDAVPFVVTTGSMFLLLYSFIPLYLHALGIRLAGALAITSVIYGAATAAAYARQVYRAEPGRRSQVPAQIRFQRLVYLMFITAGLIFLLALPLVFG